MIENRIKTVMANVLNIDVSQISEVSSADTLQNWSSLNHMSLAIALEEEFNISFKDEQLVEIISYPLIVCIIKEIMTETVAVV